MYVRPILAFKTPFYEPHYREFYDFYSLQCFLKTFDFMRTHKRSNLSTGLPIFHLGVKYEVALGDNVTQSNVKWISAFLCASNLRKDSDGKMFVSVPMDKKMGNSNAKTVYREYKEIAFNKDMVDAVINLDNFYQIWPRCSLKKTEWVKFLKSVQKIEGKIRKTRVR